MKKIIMLEPFNQYTVADFIITLMKERKMTRKEMGKILGCPGRDVERRLRVDTKMSVDELQRYLDIFGYQILLIKKGK